MREQLREQTKQYEKSENDLKALQSVGQVMIQDCSLWGNTVTGHGSGGLSEMIAIVIPSDGNIRKKQHTRLES